MPLEREQDALNTIEQQCNELTESFSWPSLIDYVDPDDTSKCISVALTDKFVSNLPPPGADHDQLDIPATSNNRKLRAYREELTLMQLSIDSIVLPLEAGGLRRQRKALIDKTEQSISVFEKKYCSIWQQFKASAHSAEPKTGATDSKRPGDNQSVGISKRQLKSLKRNRPEITEVAEAEKALEEIHRQLNTVDLSTIMGRVELPLQYTDDPLSTIFTTATPNFDLDGDAPGNAAMIQYEDEIALYQETICSVFALLENKRDATKTRLRATLLQRRLNETAGECAKAREIQYYEQREAAILARAGRFDTGPYFPLEKLARIDPWTLVGLVIVAVLHLLCRVSLDHCAFILAAINLTDMLPARGDVFEQPKKNKKPRLPKDARTVLKNLSISPITTGYVCCPKCQYLHGRSDDVGNAEIPERCTNGVQKGKDDSQFQACGAKLRRSARGKFLPQAIYRCQSIKSWLARLYARKDIEDLLRSYPHEHSSTDGVVRDIWDTDFLRKFPGPDGNPFHFKSPRESRLFLSLCEDGFNPLGNRTSGKVISNGAVYLVCLNLPPSERYRLENMCLVGIIPGPDEPSKWHISHIIKPLVNELLELYTSGVYLSRTASQSCGHLVRVALSLLVCDLPATCRMGGFSWYQSNHFCLKCMHQLEDINDLDSSTWTLRTNETHRKSAEEWLAAGTPAERQEVVNRTGTYWSELLRLPYWRAIENVAIDSMHCFYLNVLSRHIRYIWGMSIEFEDGPGITFDYDNVSDEDVDYARQVFYYGSDNELRKLKVSLLRELARENNLFYGAKRKAHLATPLINLRIKKGWFDNNGNPTFVGRPNFSDRTAAQPVQNVNPASGIFDSSSSIYLETAKTKLRNESVEALQNALIFRLRLDDVNHFVSPDTSNKHLSLDDAVDLVRSMKFKNRLEGIITQLREHDSLLGKTGRLDTEKVEQFRQTKLRDHISHDTPPSPHTPSGSSSSAHIRPSNMTNVDDPPLTSEIIGDPLSNSMNVDDAPLNNADIDKSENTNEPPPKEQAFSWGVKSSIDRLKPAALKLMTIIRFSRGDLTHILPATEYERLKDTSNKALSKEEKNRLHDVLLAARGRDTDGAVNEVTAQNALPRVKKPKRKGKPTRVLGQDRLKAIRDDMAKLQLPSWMPPGPSHPGEKKYGKLTADQWRTFCTVILPITLIRLWGHLDKDSDEHQWLQNYMHLVCAVKLATARHQTDIRIQRYEHHMRAYILGLRKLFPGTVITPYQHMTLHYPELLRRFGPTHSWRCFPFERYNGFLQKIKTNFHPGESETTILETCIMAQSLRGLIINELPGKLSALTEKYADVFDADIRGTLESEDLFFDETFQQKHEKEFWSGDDTEKIETPIYTDLRKTISRLLTTVVECPKDVFMRSSIRRLGQKFTSRDTSEANSRILARSDDASGLFKAGSIQKIFSHSCRLASGEAITKSYAWVDWYDHLPPTLAAQDAYRSYPVIGGQLWLKRSSHSSVLAIDEIICHFGHLPYSIPGLTEDCILAFPLDKGEISIQSGSQLDNI